MKALDAKNPDEAIKQLQLAVKAVPKFADGWNILGAVYEQHRMLMEARDALQHAIEANPKLTSPYLRLARISNKLGDWNAAAKNEDALLKIENRFYPEIYLQQGITRFEMKNLAGAEESLKTAQSLDAAHKLRPGRVRAGDDRACQRRRERRQGTHRQLYEIGSRRGRILRESRPSSIRWERRTHRSWISRWSVPDGTLAALRSQSAAISRITYPHRYPGRSPAMLDRDRNGRCYGSRNFLPAAWASQSP